MRSVPFARGFTRTDQIRAQLSHIGCPIIGDAKYGSSIRNKGIKIGLHAYKLEFHRPIENSPIQFVAKTPSNWFSNFKIL